MADYVSGLMTAQNRSNSASKKKASSANEPFRTIMHIDMDCFFASVGIRDKPHLVDKSVAVAHSQGGIALEYSTSEIASCNYVARSKGLRNGMFIGAAKELCPDLVIIPYDFDAYDACSRELYRTLLDSADYVQSVSCDEAFIDVTYTVQRRLMEQTGARSVQELVRRFEAEPALADMFFRVATDIAKHIKKEVLASTQCNASVGIAGNILLARIATHKAKPNGIFHLLRREDGLQHLSTLTIRDLPGIGRSTAEKCAQLQLSTCEDVQSGSNRGVLGILKTELGEKTGQTIFDYCWGTDPRMLENKPRQTVGADINWGIRFTNEQQVEAFLRQFSEEVFSRLEAIHLTAKHVTVNVKKKTYEGEPMKFLGCGECIDFSRSMVPGRAITTAAALYQCVAQLYREIGVPPLDARGIGIHLKKLQPVSGSEAVLGRWMAQDRAKTEVPSSNNNTGETQPFPFKKGGTDWSGTEDGYTARCKQVLGADSDPEAEEEEDEARDILDSAGGDGGGRGQSGEDRPMLSRVCSSSQLQLGSHQHLSGEHATDSDKAVGEGGQQESMQREVAAAAVGSQAIAPAPTVVFKGAADSGTAARDGDRSSSSVRGGGLHGLAMGDIDLDVFMALPEEIQRELQAALRGSSTSVGSGQSAPAPAGARQATGGTKRKAPSSQGLSGKGKKTVTAAPGGEKRQVGLLEMWKRGN